MKKLNLKLVGGKKKILLSATAGVLAAAVIAGAVFGLRGRGEPVGVYPFVMVGMTEFWGDNQESYGPVTTDKIQTVFLSDTQTVTEVLVKQGDQVKKGDVLMTYDTTLSELELERKRLDVEKAKLQVKEAEEQLQKIKNLTPMSGSGNTFPTVDEDWGRDIDPKGYEVSLDPAYDGSSPEKALICWIKGNNAVDNALLRLLYTQAVTYQLRNAEQGGSSASAIPEGAETIATLPEETNATEPTETVTIPPETEPDSSEPTNGSGGETGEETGGETGEPATDPYEEEDYYQSEFNRFTLTAPTTLTIRSYDVLNGGTVLVNKGDAVNLVFSSSVTDKEHSAFVSWKLTSDTTGPLTGIPNGRRSFTVCGVAENPGEVQYTVTAEYAVDGLPTLRDTYRFTLKVVEDSDTQNAVNSFDMILKTTQDDKQLAPRLIWQGVHVTVYDDGGFGFRFFDAGMVPDHMLTDLEEEDTFLDIDFSISYTAAEIAQMRKEQEKKLKELTATAKMTEAEYNLMEREFNDGNIRATLDGEVVSLLTEEESRDNRQPMMKVSGGGGFYVEGSVSELEKDRLKIGQEVTINDWNTGMTYTGEVRSIGDFPTSSNGWNGMGNPNASYYPFQVFIDGSADLQEGSYVSVTYSAAEAENGIYLENPFLRTDDGEPYVYVRGDNGRLEKRTVTTGKSLWGSYTEIRSGLTEDDYIAFPYGKTVKPGAATTESDLSALYGY